MPNDWNRLLSRKEISQLLGKGFSTQTIKIRESALGLDRCRAETGNNRIFYRGWCVVEALRERGLIK